jgi:hypothetical protein
LDIVVFDEVRRMGPRSLRALADAQAARAQTNSRLPEVLRALPEVTSVRGEAGREQGELRRRAHLAVRLRVAGSDAMLCAPRGRGDDRGLLDGDRGGRADLGSEEGLPLVVEPVADCLSDEIGCG